MITYFWLVKLVIIKKLLLATIKNAEEMNNL